MTILSCSLHRGYCDPSRGLGLPGHGTQMLWGDRMKTLQALAAMLLLAEGIASAQDKAPLELSRACALPDGHFPQYHLDPGSHHWNRHRAQERHTDAGFGGAFPGAVAADRGSAHPF